MVQLIPMQLVSGNATFLRCELFTNYSVKTRNVPKPFQAEMGV